MSDRLIIMMRNTMEVARDHAQKHGLRLAMRHYFAGQIDALSLAAGTEESFALKHTFNAELRELQDKEAA